MNLPDLLSYADIDQLQKIATNYELPQTHSKHELIKSLLTHMQRPVWWSGRTESIPNEEKRFWQLLFLDSRDSFNMEELLGKGRQALDGKEGNPRVLIARAIKAGLLFPGVSSRHRSLYRVPHDVRKSVITALRDHYVREMVDINLATERDEQLCMVTDLRCFLNYVGEEDVRLTREAAIYRQDLQSILSQMVVKEVPIKKERFRFGFGRRYHQYPDRFSLIYDYAYYRGYIAETGQTLSLLALPSGKRENKAREAEEMYLFWVRLYRKPFPALPLIIKWVYLLAHSEWVALDHLRECLTEWLVPYYYMSKDALFELLMKMLVHLGVIRSASTAIKMTESGKTWIERSSGWDLGELDERFITLGDQNFFANQQGISMRALNKL